MHENVGEVINLSSIHLIDLIGLTTISILIGNTIMSIKLMNHGEFRKSYLLGVVAQIVTGAIGIILLWVVS